MLFRLLRSAKNWVFELGKGIADAEDRMAALMFKERDNNESN